MSTGSNLAEVVSSTVIGAFNGSFYSLGTGSKGTKPDNVIALLTMDLDSLDPKNNKNYDLIVQKIQELRNIMNDLTGTLKSENTTKYYKTQQENWKKAEEEMTKVLNELTELYGQVVDCYTIEDSTKNYLFLNARARGNLNESFHGGSLGAHLADQLNKINALAQTGGFSMVDIKWLTSVIINSGPGMIASEAKNSIEQYLATFATILLFDDQVNIADDAIHQMTENSGSSVNKIHLFSLNGGYYPLSYVLYLTHTALSKGYDDILQEV